MQLSADQTERLASLQDRITNPQLLAVHDQLGLIARTPLRYVAALRDSRELTCLLREQ
jgi:hypothetical protein